MGRIVNGIIFLVMAGLLVAVLREFNWDPFAVVEWAFDKAWSVINRVADLFSDNETFKEVTKEPAKK